MIKRVVDSVLGQFGYAKTVGLHSIPTGITIPAPQKTEQFIKSYRGWVYANVKRRSEQMTSVDIILMEVDSQGNVEEVLDHPSTELLNEVNEHMTRLELFEVTYAHLDLAGEAFWAVDRGVSGLGDPESIVPLLPYRVTIIPGDEELIERFEYRRTGKNGDEKIIPIKPSDIVFFKEPDPNNLIRGMSVVRAAAITIDNDQSAEEWNFSSFENGASGRPVFETEATISPDDLKRHYTELAQNFSGKHNANKPMILHGGLKSSQIGFSPRDMEFLASQRWTRDKQMAIIGTTKTVLGITEDVNRSNAEANQVVFVTYMVQPRVKKFAAYLNEFYLPMFKGTENMFFMAEDTIPADVKSETELFTKALAGASWLTQNEVRAQKGFSSVEGGDVLYAPSGLVAIDATDEVKTAAPRKYINEYHKMIHTNFVSRKRKIDKRAKEIKDIVSPVVHALAKELLKQDEEDTVAENKDIRVLAQRDGGFVDGFQKGVINFEKMFKTAIQARLLEQEKAVNILIDQLFNRAATWKVKAPQDKFLPDFKDFFETGVGVITPLLSLVLEERGNEAMFFIGTRLSIDLKNPKAEQFIEENAGRLIKDIDETTRNQLGKALATGLDEAEGVAQLKERVRAVFDKASDSRAELIARTEVVKASNFASQEAWRQTGVVEAKQWFTAGDDRVDPLCMKLDGKVASLNENFFEGGDTFTVVDPDEGRSSIKIVDDVPVPPLHPGCRCVLLPVLKGSKSYTKIKRAKPKLPKQTKQEKRLDERIKKLEHGKPRNKTG
ncbi:hypothetical protein LCGC14_0418170 [marine sediment metagenome]|uniref:Phage head morphogenesis domain-containing protein n=1 Tax=marine sediment metagenome TaxID=412755 RepID=A0A0F9VDU7_9ZZZZ